MRDSTAGKLDSLTEQAFKDPRSSRAIVANQPKYSAEMQPEQNQVSTYNATLDTEQKYCKVDLLRHIDDTHLLKRISRHTAALTHLPVDTVMLIGMTAYSSMAARKYAVLYQSGKQLPIGLYSVAEQPSGTGKSWCINIFMEPFEAVQKAAIDQVYKAINRIENKAISLAENAGHLEESDAKELKELKEKAKRLNTGLYVSNATPEGLESTLPKTSGFFSAISSEQGLFNSLLGGSYKAEGSANNNDMVLNGYDGGYVNSVRVSRPGYHGHVVGSVACFAQQGSIETVLKASNGTGLAERFLMLAEPHMLGRRDHTKWPEPKGNLEAEYAKACMFIEGILEEPRDMDGLSNLVISKNGFLKINQYRNRIEPYLADGGKYSHVSLRGAASKINMQIMKIAATLHLIDVEGDGQHRPDIDDKHTESAIEIANELLEANLKLCQDKGILGLKAEFTAILNYLSKPGKTRSLQRDISNSLRTTQPFKDHTGNKAGLITTTLDEMVTQGLLNKHIEGARTSYSMM